MVLVAKKGKLQTLVNVFYAAPDFILEENIHQNAEHKVWKFQKYAEPLNTIKLYRLTKNLFVP